MGYCVGNHFLLFAFAFTFRTGCFTPLLTGVSVIMGLTLSAPVVFYTPLLTRVSVILGLTISGVTVIIVAHFDFCHFWGKIPVSKLLFQTGRNCFLIIQFFLQGYYSFFCFRYISTTSYLELCDVRLLEGWLRLQVPLSVQTEEEVKITEEEAFVVRIKVWGSGSGSRSPSQEGSPLGLGKK